MSFETDSQSGRSSSAETLRHSISALVRKPSFLWQVAGGAFYGIFSYGAMIFIVSHLVRSFSLPLSQAGTVYGTISTVTAIVGALAGGYLTDRMGRASCARVPLLTGALMIVALPAYITALLTDNFTVFAVCALVAGCVVFAAGPPLFAGIHIVCGSRRRATAIALLYFLMNSIGLGGGPVLTGVLSDAFAVHYGSAMGLRIAIVVGLTALLPGGLCFVLAARSMVADEEP